jgi:Protein of unknown function (DUF4199)
MRHRLEGIPMLRIILTCGVVAGLIVVVPMALYLLNADPAAAMNSQFAAYLVMILALSLIFVGVKRFRDRALGGVIKFVPAFLMGLGISAVAGAVYVVGWEIVMALTDFSFIDTYSTAMIDAARAKGAAPAEIEAITAEMAAFSAQYANPLFRMPMTFIEIFPVGFLISLISAALLRNSRFLPARTIAPR